VGEPRRMPAFGGAVLRNRRIGWHPLFVKLLYGDDWRDAFAHRRLAKSIPARIPPYTRKWIAVAGWPVTVISPREYERGAFDLRLYAGVDVEVIDQVDGLNAVERNGSVYTKFGRLFDLLAELAAIAGSVRARAPGERWASDVESIAFVYKSYDHARGVSVYPPWWTSELKQRYDERQAAHARDLANYAAV
jgi:hypothetical protein